MRYATFDDKIVTNVVSWDGVTRWAGAASAVVVPDGVPVAAGWTYDGETWSPPGLSLDEALEAIDRHAAGLLESGVTVDGVRLSLDADRLDWLGLLTLAGTLLAAAGGTIPVVGLDGRVLLLRSVEQISEVAGQLATHRLYVQALSAGARASVVAAVDGAERSRLVASFREVA